MNKVKLSSLGVAAIACSLMAGFNSAYAVTYTCDPNIVSGSFLRVITDPLLQATDSIMLHSDHTVYANQSLGIAKIQQGSFIPNIGAWKCGSFQGKTAVIATYTGYAVVNSLSGSSGDFSAKDATIRTDVFLFTTQDPDHPTLVNRAAIDYCGSTTFSDSENKNICSGLGSLFTVGYVPTTNILSTNPVLGAAVTSDLTASQSRPYVMIKAVDYTSC